MSALEKSDLPVVAPKRANKAASAAAEPVERRDGAKENADLRSTVRTLSREAVSQAQGRIREAVIRNRQQEQAGQADGASASRQHQRFAGEFLRSEEDRGAGRRRDDVDRTCEHFEANLRELHVRVHTGAYRALPSRRKYIPKADGRQRPLGIP